MARKTSTSVRKQDSRANRRDSIISITFLAVVVVGTLIAILYGNGVFEHGDHKINIETGEAQKGVTAYSDSTATESSNISVPGYEKLEFLAGKKQQKVYLQNPKENTCYFKLSLKLEDGTTLWQSDLLEPGMAFDRIALKQSLKKGTYENATLQYQCYALADQRELNGSAIQLNLEVQ